MAKEIKIFLASSIEDLKIDRLEIGDFFRELNDIYATRELRFKLIKCEGYDKSIAEDGKQPQYDEEIRDSELVFFLFFKKVGEYTKHEFEVALDNFREVHKPKIVTYIKYVNSIEEVNDDVKSFMNILDCELKHYYSTYSCIDTLKLGMIMQIKLMNLDNTVVDIQDGRICVNGTPVADSSNIPMFTGSDIISRLKKRLTELTEEFNKLKEKRREFPDDEDIYIEFSNVASEKADTEEKLRKKEMQMFSLAEKMTADMASGDLTQRQLEGYRLLEKGDYSGALEVLDVDEILKELDHNEELKKSALAILENVNKSIQKNINELLQRIDVLMGNSFDDFRDKESIELCECTDRYKEIIELYECACKKTEKHNLNRHVFYEYAYFLSSYMNDYDKALEVAEKLNKYYICSNEDAQDDTQGKLYTLLTNLYSIRHQPKQAEEFGLKSIEIYKNLYDKNKELYGKVLADRYFDIGNIYYQNKQNEKTKEFYLKAIYQYEKLSNSNLKNDRLSCIYHNLAHLYVDIKEIKNAEYAYLKMIEYEEKIGCPDAFPYMLVALFYHYDMKDMGKAEIFYLKALDKYKKRKIYTVKINGSIFPQNSADSIAHVYEQLGLLYVDLSQLNKAENFFLEALKIYKELDFELFKDSIAIIYDELGKIYISLQRKDEAEKFFIKAIEAYEECPFCNERLKMAQHNLALCREKKE